MKKLLLFAILIISLSGCKAQNTNINIAGGALVADTIGNVQVRNIFYSDTTNVLIPVTTDGISVSSNFHKLSAASSQNINYIFGGQPGQVLTLLFTDSNITLIDNNTHAANTIDMSGNYTSADDGVLIFICDGISWYLIGSNN